MDCADEVAILKRELQPLVGSHDRLSFDILRGKMTVADGTPPASVDAVIQTVARTGMRAVAWSDVQPQAADRDFWERRGRTVMTAASGIALVTGFLSHAWARGIGAAIGSEGLSETTPVPIPSIAFYGIAIAAGAWFVVPRAWRAALRVRPDMNLLMTIAVVGAIAIGEWFEAATVSFLFAVSLALESWSVGRARQAVEALLAIAPPTARVLRTSGPIEVSAEHVLVGEKILVKPGDRIPLDGAVTHGISHVNQAPITGESMPVEKGEGAEVYAGTINGDGVLEVEVTRVVGETALAQIIRMVSEAQSRRAAAEQWVDRFAQAYTPAILAAAVAIAVVPPLTGFGDAGGWFYRALVLLVIGCPCALVISTPVSIVASIAAAARNGVLVKGGTFVESPGQLQAVAMDKTGTLTEGVPRVIDVVPSSGHTETELLRVIGALEARSDHPLARAITSFVQSHGIDIPPSTDVRAVQGRGMTAVVESRRYWLGSHRYLEELGQATSEIQQALEARSSAGRTVVVVGTDDDVCGFVTLSDAVRPQAVHVVRALRESGVKHVVMLTGDNQATAERIGRETGVDEVRAELLPADKVLAVEQLVQQFGSVAMIGDGVNDAPAMGRATIGVAMAAVGSDAAIEAADVALMSDDLAKLPWLIRHSRRTLSVIRQNVALSLGVKAAFVILTFTGHATLWSAIAADMGVSLVVVANALRLLRVNPLTTESLL
jgi:Cd2+/Zn2+-exporting ATPase